MGEVRLEDGSSVGFVEVQSHPGSRRRRWRHVVLAGLAFAAVVALLVGLAQAQTTVKVREGETLVLLIDVSGSMRADDVAPSRMAAAQASARTFISALPREMRIGLVSFSSGVTVLVAPTEDHEQARRAIDGLAPEGATAMGDALVAGLRLIGPEALAAAQAAPSTALGAPIPPPAERIPASILLISDGANTVGQVHPWDAADLARQLGVPIYAVALGTPEGMALIPDGRGGEQLREVPPDIGTLQELADVTAGEFYRARSASRLAGVYDDIDSKVTRRDERRRAVYWSLGTGVALLAVTAGLGLAWRKKLR